MLLQNQKTIAVIVTNHNYEQYLPDALSSIQRQTLSPNEVIIIDDNSTIPCYDIVKSYGYQYINTNFTRPLLARKAGFHASKSELICFLDADDKLPTTYLSQAVNTINDGADIAFTDLQHFGLKEDITNIHPHIPSKRLWQVNFLHAGCVTKRIAIQLSEAFDGHPNHANYHEDWLFWRKIVGYGFKYAKYQSPYLARVHNHNRSAKIKTLSYAEQRIIDDIQIIWHDYRNKNINFLRYLNQIAANTKSDYVCIGIKPNDNYDWNKLLRHLDHDVAMVHDSKYQMFDRTLIVGPILKDYIYTSLSLPFNTKTEKVIII